MSSSISHLQNKSSEVIESIIQRNYRSMSSYNLTAILDISSFSTCSNTSDDSNQSIHQKPLIWSALDPQTPSETDGREVNQKHEAA